MKSIKKILSAPQAIKTLISGQATLYVSEDDDWNDHGLVLIKLQKELYRDRYSYFVRAYDLSNGNNTSDSILNHEIHIPFIVKRRKQFFIYFPTADCHIGLSFFDEEIADDFLNIIKEINSYEKEQIELNLNESFFSSPKRDSNKNGIKSSGQMKAITSSIPAISYDKMKKKKMESIPEIENDSENDDDEQSESEKDESSEKTEKRGKFVKIKKVESESEDEPVKTVKELKTSVPKKSCIKKNKETKEIKESKEPIVEINEKKAIEESKEEKNRLKVSKKEKNNQKEETDQVIKMKKHHKKDSKKLLEPAPSSSGNKTEKNSSSLADPSCNEETSSKTDESEIA